MATDRFFFSNTFHFYCNLFCYLLTYLFTYLFFYSLLCINVVDLLSIKKKKRKKKKKKKILCRQFQWMKKEFTGTSTVESVSDNLNNEDLACVAGGLLFFWYDFFFLDSYSKGYCANSVSASLQHLCRSNSYFVNHKTTPKKPPATQTYEELVAACQM